MRLAAQNPRGGPMRKQQCRPGQEAVNQSHYCNLFLGAEAACLPPPERGVLDRESRPPETTPAGRGCLEYVDRERADIFCRPQRGGPQRGGPPQGEPGGGGPPRSGPQRGGPPRGEPQRGGPPRGDPPQDEPRGGGP